MLRVMSMKLLSSMTSTCLSVHFHFDILCMATDAIVSNLEPNTIIIKHSYKIQSASNNKKVLFWQRCVESMFEN